MTRIIVPRLTAVMTALLTALLLSACANTPTHYTHNTYDLGALPATNSASTPAPLSALSMAEVSTPAWLDSTDMVYRLSYANPQQSRAYANSHWSVSPAQLLEQRTMARLATSGGVVVAATDNALNLPLLRLDLQDFSQDFSTPSQASVHVQIRATLFSKRILVAQKTFQQRVPTPSPDAAGAALALSHASDRALDELLPWLVQLQAQLPAQLQPLRQK